MTAFERLLAALEAAGHRTTGNGRQRMAQCPAHDDGHASLSVTQGNDRVLVKCQAGCDTDEVLATLNLTRGDLFDAPLRSSNGRQIVATYDYTDEAGQLLYQAVRYEPKGFQQRRPDGNGGWIYKLGDTRRVLYRLPQVLAAAMAGQTIYVVEGEKDVHSVEKADAVATCNSGGAGNGKWKPAHTAALTGANVTIVTDLDAPGRAHANQILTALTKAGITARILAPTAGKDVTDHLAAGLGLDDLAPVASAGNDDAGTRHIVLTRASDIKPRPVFWLWKNRLALGTLGLLAGRQGAGKSTLAYWIAARLTRGELYGHYQGKPKAVLICAAEDAWDFTIVPRLMAAGADLTRIHRVEVVSALGAHVGLSLPGDLGEVEKSAIDTDAALMLLDPLMSRLGKLDTHRDAEVRQALEPLVDVCNRVSMSAFGLIHHNKSASTDPLQLVMASTAFTAVARSVHTVMRDPDDDTNARRLFGTPKNNLGRDDLPTFSFTISGHPIDTDEGVAWTGRLDWGDEQTATIEDAMARAADNSEDKSAVTEAADWLSDYVTSRGGQVPSSDAKKAGRAAGHAERTLKRASQRLALVVSIGGYPRASFWELPPTPDPVGSAGPGHPHVGPTGPTDSIGERSSTTTTTTTPSDLRLCDFDGSSDQSGQSGQVSGSSRARPDPTGSGWEQTELGQRSRKAGQ